MFFFNVLRFVVKEGGNGRHGKWNRPIIQVERK